MFAPQLAELSHMISTFGTSFFVGEPAKMSMSSAPAIVAALASAATIASRHTIGISLAMSLLGDDSFAEARRVGARDADCHALIDGNGRAGLRIRGARRDIPLAVRAQRIAARRGGARTLDVDASTAARNETGL